VQCGGWRLTRPVCELAEVIGNKHKLSDGRFQSFYVALMFTLLIATRFQSKIKALKPGCYQQGKICAITGVAPVKDPSLHNSNRC
jgi:hypothetical protein